MTEQLEDFLSHYGVKGQKWGVRRNRPSGVSGKVNREAAKDAKEFARAKMYYGKGAGTRRKLINAKVAQKSNSIPGYKAAFEQHQSGQNLGTHADRAVRERNRTDRRERNRQRGGAVARRLTGEMGTQAAFVALAAGGVMFMRSSRGQAVRARGLSTIRNLNDERLRRQGAAAISEVLRRSGV